MQTRLTLNGVLKYSVKKGDSELAETDVLYKYSETNVMQFFFSLLKILGLYMFPALLPHPQEVLNKQHLVYCVRIMSVGCGTVAVKLRMSK
jgi:hypothetical protein